MLIVSCRYVNYVLTVRYLIYYCVYIIHLPVAGNIEYNCVFWSVWIKSKKYFFYLYQLSLFSLIQETPRRGGWPSRLEKKMCLVVFLPLITNGKKNSFPFNTVTNKLYSKQFVTHFKIVVNEIFYGQII